MYKMLEEIEDMRRAEQAALKAAAEVKPLTEEHLAQHQDKGKKKAGQMWTDRYRPSKFVDLLGDDVRRPLSPGDFRSC
jgi:hypothetical protein